MDLQLTIFAGPDAGRVCDIGDGQTVIVGRGDKSDFRLADPSVSRIHFELGNRDEEYVISDRGSSSGTFVDGKQITTGTISLDSVIQIGDTRIRLIKKNKGDYTNSPVNQADVGGVKPLKKLIGTQLGPYELLEIIGKGNNGLVFKARDAEKNRIAAVKVLTPQFTANDEQRQRFVRAMRTMLPIKDPRIVDLYNAGKNGPYCWAAMEYIDGENLSELIERTGIEGMLDWKKVWQIAVDVARALNKGYENKIIHRNVTPANILRRHSDKACLLGDFMLAKALEGTLAQQVTQPGQLLGDIPYMAPERTRANMEVDTRSDLYGLGATCYALLTGRPAVSGDSLVEMLSNVRNETPRAPKSYQLAINDLFEGIVMQLLEKNPDNRLQTPSDLIKELVRIGRYQSLDPGF
jgi:serine/threonine protein kinase